MAFYGRHRVMVLFWPWYADPFVTISDIESANISKSVDGGGTARIRLYPRNVPRGINARGTVDRYDDRRYADVLKPNDWIFVWVDTGGNDPPEPLFLGFIDRVNMVMSLGDDGTRNYRVSVSATGWEKAIQNTTAIAHPYIASQINIPTLISLGPAGAAAAQRSRGASEATPGVSIFQDTLPNVVEWLVHLFLTANRTLDADTAALATVNEVNSLLGVADQGEDPDDDIRPLTGQFHLPNSDTPLWSFVKLKFQDLNQRVFVNPTMFQNQQNSSLADLIDMFANQIINSVIYDVRRISQDGLSDLDNDLIPEITGGYSRSRLSSFIETAQRVSRVVGALADDVAPYMILRKRPLFTDELAELDGPVIDDSDITEYDLGPSDSDLHNMTMIDIPSLSNNSPARLVSGFPGFEEHKGRTLSSIRRHGMRLLQETTSAWPGEYAAPHPSAELVREWDIRLHLAGLDNVRNFAGSITIPKYINGLFIGGKLGVIHGANDTTVRAVPRVYYVDSLDYSYNVLGTFSTSVGVVRGQDAEGLTRT